MAVPKQSKMPQTEASRRQYRAKVDSAGRVLIPAALRKQYGFMPGTEVMLGGDNGRQVSIRSVDAIIAEAQGYFSQFKKPGEELWSEQLIRERHELAKREYGG